MIQYRNQDHFRLHDLMRMVIGAQRANHPYLADATSTWEHLDHVVMAFVEEFTQLRDFGMLCELFPPRILYSVAKGEEYGGFKTNPERYGMPIWSDDDDKLTDPQIFSLFISCMVRDFRNKPESYKTFDETWKELPESTIELGIVLLWREIMADSEKQEETNETTCSG